MNVSDLANISWFVLIAAAILFTIAGAVVGHMCHNIAVGIAVLCGGIAATCITLRLVWAWMPTLYATAPYDSAATTLGDMLADNLWVLPSINILATTLTCAIYMYSTTTTQMRQGCPRF